MAGKDFSKFKKKLTDALNSINLSHWEKDKRIKKDKHQLIGILEMELKKQKNCKKNLKR